MEVEIAYPMHASHSKPFSSTCKQTYTEMITNAGASAMYDDDPYMSTESLKRRRLNPKMYSLVVVEQPKSIGLRFVKSGQSPTAGSYVMGETITTHPSLLLTNYKGPVKFVWYLVADDVMYPHPYILEGEDCEDGVCTKTIKTEGQIISFPGLYVRSVARREVQKMLEKRLGILKKHLPGEEFKLKDTMEYNLRAVRICFQAVLPECKDHDETLKTVLTRLLRCKELMLQREPCILSISQCKGSVHGREELSMQVTNLETDDVMVLFHCESLVPRTSWQALAEVISVSRKMTQPVNIVIRTPPYYNQRISEPQTVAVQIRLNDNSFSNTVMYTYTPQAKGVSFVGQRVKQKEPIYVRYFTCLGATSHVDPVLKTSKLNGYDKDKAESSQETARVRMFVYNRKEKEQQANWKMKPRKMNVGSQTDMQSLRSWDSLQGYNSEEELGAGEDRVDYKRLYWYRSLMMGDKSPSDSGKTREKDDDMTPTHGTESNPQVGQGMTLKDFTPRGLLGSLQSASDKSEGEAQSQGNALTGLSDNSSSIESENALRMMPLQKLESLSLHEEGKSFPLVDTTSLRNTDGFSYNPELPKEFGSSRQEYTSPVEGVHQDIHLEKKGSASNDPETVDTCSTSAMNRHLGSYSIFCNDIILEYTKQEVVPEPPGASNHPDLSKSNLFPAKLVHNNQLVAIKKIAKHLYQEDAYSLWHSLNHKNLITLLGLVKEETSISLILTFPDNGCLKEYLSRMDSSLTWQTRMKWLEQVARGLEHLHQNGLAHQEVRIENCLISEDYNLMLGIPSTMVVARPLLEGKSLESKSLPDEIFEKAKAEDVFSFAIFMWELLGMHLPKTTSKLHMSSKDMQLSYLESLLYECQHEDTSQRPAIPAVARKIQTLRQHGPMMFMASGAPSVVVDPASNDQTLDQHSVTVFDDLTEVEPKTPDSGICFSQTGKAKDSTRTAVNLSTVASAESSFSDDSQRSRSNSITERAESVVTDFSSSGQSQAANLTSPEAVKMTNGEAEAQETQELHDTQTNDNKKTDEKGTDDCHEDSYRQDGDHSKDGRQNEILGSHLCPPRVTKQVDHTGGVLTILNGEISLTIPPGAIREGQVEDITLTVDWNDQHIPPLMSTDMNVAPIVHCGPTGLKFEKPVLLRIPHCAVMPNKTKQSTMTVHCSQTNEGEPPQWERISGQDNPDMEVECEDRCFLLHVTHFCSFTITLSDGKVTQVKEIMLVAYGPIIRTFEEDQEIRIYLYDSHRSNRELIRQEEVYLNGKQLDGPCSYQLHDLHQGHVVVQVEYHDQAWLLRSALQSTRFPFCKVWNMQLYSRCKFTWSNSANVTQFRCHIVAHQEKNDDRATLEISNHVKISPQSSCPRASSSSDSPTVTCQATDESGQAGPQMVHYDSRMSLRRDVSFQFSHDSGNTTTPPLVSSYLDSQRGLGEFIFPQGFGVSSYSSMSSAPPEIIPYGLKQLLCNLLDPNDNALGNDWRKLAAEFGYGGCIKQWERKDSPTNCVLDVIVQQQKIKSLTDLKQRLKNITRMDAAQEVDKYIPRQLPGPDTLAIQPCEDDPVNMSDTPSPDDINHPLVAGGMPHAQQELTSQNGRMVAPTNMNQSHDQEGSQGETESVESHSPHVSSQNQSVVNSGVQQQSLATPVDVTPSRSSFSPRFTHTHQTDENENMKGIEHGVKRMLFSDKGPET